MIQKIKGTMDILPNETPLFRYIEGVMREEAEKYGYGEIRTPTFENTELFVRGVGDTTDVVQKEMYTFADRDENRSISLRPEGTASVVRAIIERSSRTVSAPIPCRLSITISSPASVTRSHRRAEAVSSSSSAQRCSDPRVLLRTLPR